MFIQKISKYYFEKIGQQHIQKKILEICLSNKKHVELQLDVLFRDPELRKYTIETLESMRNNANQN